MKKTRNKWITRGTVAANPHSAPGHFASCLKNLREAVHYRIQRLCYFAGVCLPAW